MLMCDIGHYEWVKCDVIAADKSPFNGSTGELLRKYNETQHIFHFRRQPSKYDR